MIQKIAVYCGTATGNSPVYVKAATDLGQYLADHRQVSLWWWQRWFDGRVSQYSH